MKLHCLPIMNIALGFTDVGDEYGPELLTNGDFTLWTEPGTPNDYPTSWSLLGSTASYYISQSTGKVSPTNSDTLGNCRIYQIVATPGKTYRVQGTVSGLGGPNSIGFACGSGNYNATANGSFSEQIVASSAIFLISFQLTNTGATLDNVSVKEVL